MNHHQRKENKIPSSIHIFGMHAMHSCSEHFLPVFGPATQLCRLKMNFWASRRLCHALKHRQCKNLFHPGGLHKRASSYWCKLNLRYTVYNELQKEIHTTVPVLKPNKHLSLRRALLLILQFTIYIEIYFVNGGVNTGVRSELVTGEWQSSGPAGRFNRQCLPLPHYHRWGALEQSP